MEYSMQTKYPNLFSEIVSLETGWGYDKLSALEYISDNLDAYLGTAVYAEFMRSIRGVSDSISR
jgi:hypothetical protein